MKKVLIVAAKANMIRQFNQHNILILKNLGFEIHVGTNFKEFGSMDGNENQKLIDWLNENQVTMHQLDFGRRLGSMKSNLLVIKQIKDVLRRYDDWAFLHAHSPIGSVLGRIAAKQVGIKTIYTAHGFHFFKGGPVKNWLIFPVEWIMTLLTDQLIVINTNDLRVSKLLPIKQKNVTYIPSVGIDVKKMMSKTSSEKEEIRNQKRNELGLTDEDFVLFNVGELSDLKNQKIIIEAMGKINNPKLKLMIAGVGPNKENYLNLAKDLELENNLMLLGYRNDIQALHYASDLFVFPSLREGFGLGGFEALVDGLKVIGTKNTGMVDYIVGPAYGVLLNSKNVNEVVDAINIMMQPDYAENEKVDVNVLEQFDSNNVDKIMEKIYIKYK